MTITIRQNILEFGDQLIQTGDIDPVYIAMVGAKIPKPQLARALFAYWYFYHLGFAAWVSEQDDYWGALKVAALNTTESPVGGRWPRGAERRHFRGQACIKALDTLPRIGITDPLATIEYLATRGTEQRVMASVERWPMMGSWGSFKVADMLERVWGAPITFDRNLGLMYEQPRAALDLLAATPEFEAVDRSPKALYEMLLAHFGKHRAPPSGDRYCGPAETETCCCKWKSHMNGKYEVGKDLNEVQHALRGWGATAERMLMAVNTPWHEQINTTRAAE